MYMTALQNAYWQRQEDIRHNKEMESVSKADAASKRLQAQAAQTQAGVAERNIALEERMEPYEKWLKGSQSAKNVAGAVQEGTKAAKNVFDIKKGILDGVANILFG